MRSLSGRLISYIVMRLIWKRFIRKTSCWNSFIYMSTGAHGGHMQIFLWSDWKMRKNCQFITGFIGGIGRPSVKTGTGWIIPRRNMTGFLQIFSRAWGAGAYIFSVQATMRRILSGDLAEIWRSTPSLTMTRADRAWNCMG